MLKHKSRLEGNTPRFTSLQKPSKREHRAYINGHEKSDQFILYNPHAENSSTITKFDEITLVVYN
ncbi:protein of unknown function (plasmid) [Shinella sp. WSC3-e]|nr:protein of unknown function [Shinella sp. WSC3-e]